MTLSFRDVGEACVCLIGLQAHRLGLNSIKKSLGRRAFAFATGGMRRS
jgi:hypothetical protein